MRSSTPTNPTRSREPSTSRTMTSASGWTRPSTTKNAACDGSPGTSHSRGWGRPGVSVTRRPGPSSTLCRATPACTSMFSVVERVRTASATTVCPPADSPASKTADFTWALGTGTSYSTPRNSREPTTVNGA